MPGRTSVTGVAAALLGLCALWIAVLAIADDAPVAEQPPESADSPRDRALAQQRDELVAEALRLYRERRLNAAVATAERAVEIQRAISGGDDDAVADILDWIANVLVETDDYAAALARRRHVLQIRSSLHGQRDWRTVNSRLGVERVERLHKGTEAERRAISRAGQLRSEAQARQTANDFAQAATLFEQALELRRGVFGEEQFYARALVELASLAGAQNDPAKAERLLQRAVATYRKVLGEDHPDYAEALHKWGAACAVQDKHQVAVEHCEAALAIYKRLFPGGSAGEATALHTLALSLDWSGQQPQALARYQELIEVRRRVFGGKSTQVVDALIEVGDLLANKYAKHEEAIPYYTEALALLRELPGDHQLRIAEALTNLARAHTAEGRFREATPLLLEAVAMKRRALPNDDPRLAEALLFAGNVLTATMPAAQILELRSEAVEVLRRAKETDPWELAQALLAQASAHRDVGDTARAMRCVEEIEQIAEQGGEGFVEVRYQALSSKGGILAATGRYTEALPLLEESVAGMATLPTQRLAYANVLSDLASVYDALGDSDRSRQLMLESAEVTRGFAGEYSLAYGLALLRFGLAAFNTSDVEPARRAFEQSLSIFQESFGEDSLASALGHFLISACHLVSRQHVDAEREARIANETFTRLAGTATVYRAMANQLLAKTLRAQGQLEQAIERYRESLESVRAAGIENSFAYADLLVDLSATELARGERQVAAEGYRRALAIRRQFADAVFAQLSERQQLALTNSIRGNLDVCLTLDDQFSATELYDATLRWKGAVHARQRWMRAQEKSPQLQARFAQLETISAALARAGFGGPNDGESPTAYAGRIEALTRDKERIEAELSEASRSFAEARIAQRLDADGLGKLLPANVVLFDFLEYDSAAAQIDRLPDAPGQPQLAAFVVSRDSPVRLVQLGPAAAIEEGCTKFVAALELGYDREAGEELRRKLWDPLCQGLPRDRIVLVSPDGVTARVPWSALPGRDASRYLLEETSVAIVPVPQLISEWFDRPRPASPAPTDLLLVGGDFAYGSQRRAASAAAGASRLLQRLKFDPLPATAREVVEVAQLARATQPRTELRVLTDEAGTEATFRRLAPAARHIHLATHGFCEPLPKSTPAGELPQLMVSMPFPAVGPGAIPVLAQANPDLFSGLALAGANRHATRRDPDDDGLLTAAEVAGLLLDRADLVVLSACQTGLGQPRVGEGLLGLQRSFQIAGARTTIASLWNVDDKATAALMKVFYHKLWIEKVPPLEALRGAQLAILNHPEEIETLVSSRGPGLAKAVEALGARPASLDDQPAHRTPARFWGAFVLSGDWR